MFIFHRKSMKKLNRKSTFWWPHTLMKENVLQTWWKRNKDCGYSPYHYLEKSMFFITTCKSVLYVRK